ncbi:MAG: winged helix-turn-helix transcriptional regulator [Ruminococcaceae bacterium]|nr:winged helix-turn-helix transcriptional regulator [Oscillospiraceae bacterium]
MEERFKLFTVYMTKIRRSIQKIKTEEMAEYNLKSPHVSCLYYLYKYGKMTATELCEICDEDKASISRSIVQLEKEEYVFYPDGSRKRYRAQMALTPKGEKIAIDLARKIDRVLELVGDGVTEESRQNFYKNLALISDNLEEICKQYDK